MQSSGRRSFRKDSLRIEALLVPPFANNVYIVYEDGTDYCLIIDVAQGADQIFTRLKELELKPKLIINTHGHTDHTVEDDKLRRLTGAKLAIHELDAYRLAAEDEAVESLRIEKIPIEPDIQLITGQEIKVGKNTSFAVLHTPGHTEGSICLHDKTRGVLFSGDTLFARGYGRVDGSGADAGAMKDSLKRLMELPPGTEVYPGHGGFTTIGNEKEWVSEMLGEIS